MERAEAPEVSEPVERSMWARLIRGCLVSMSRTAPSIPTSPLAPMAATQVALRNPVVQGGGGGGLSGSGGNGGEGGGGGGGSKGNGGSGLGAHGGGGGG